MFDFTSLAFSLQSFLKDNGISLKRSHGLEVVAAMLGYKTYAACKTTATTAKNGPTLSDADFVILQPEAAHTRAMQLGLTKTQADLCIQEVLTAMTNAATVSSARVYGSFDDFRDSYLHDYIADAAETSDEASAAMAETNAYVDSVYVEEILEETELLDQSSDWVVSATGQLEMDQDPDKPFHGDKVLFTVRLFFDKVDRVGLIHVDTEVSAGLDDSWREPDDME